MSELSRKLARMIYDKDYRDERLNAYDEISEEHPIAKLGASFVPGVGQVMAAGDVAAEANKGNYGRAAINAIGFVPGGKLASAGINKAMAAERALGKTIAPEAASTLAKASEQIGEKAVGRTDLGNRFYSAAEPFMHSNADAATPTQVALAEDTGAGYKRGGRVKKATPRAASKPVKKASSASRRGDGIAQRGKTKGRMV